MSSVEDDLLRTDGYPNYWNPAMHPRVAYLIGVPSGAEERHVKPCPPRQTPGAPVLIAGLNHDSGFRYSG